jgi:hypothetical protein
MHASTVVRGSRVCTTAGRAARSPAAATALPMSAGPQPISFSSEATARFASASLPQKNIVGGPPGNFGSIMTALPTELNALTNRAPGTCFCSRSISESPGPVKNCRTPSTGGASAIGLVVDDDLAVEMFGAGKAQRLFGGGPLHGKDDDVGGGRNVGKGAGGNAGVGGELRQLFGRPAADPDLLPMLLQTLRQGLGDVTRTEDPDTFLHFCVQTRQ